MWSDARRRATQKSGHETSGIPRDIRHMRKICADTSETEYALPSASKVRHFCGKNWATNLTKRETGRGHRGQKYGSREGHGVGKSFKLDVHTTVRKSTGRCFPVSAVRNDEAVAARNSEHRSSAAGVEHE